jgi:outer membrane protein TolC
MPKYSIAWGATTVSGLPFPESAVPSSSSLLTGAQAGNRAVPLRALTSCIWVGVLVFGSGHAYAQAESAQVNAPGQAIPGTSKPNDYASSVPAKAVPGVMQLSLEDAIEKGLRQNLGLLLSHADILSARGERWEQLSALLPHVTASPSIDASKINIEEGGLAGLASKFHISPAVGPFSYFDARAGLTQSLFDWQSISATRAASQNFKSANYSYKDAHDVVLLAVVFTYVQAVADEARVETAEAQVKTAQSLYDQASDQVNAGTAADIDALRSQVELETRQQQLIQAKNDFAIQKLTVARVIGLAPGQEFELTDKSPYQPFEGISVETAIGRAFSSRSDYQAATADVRAAEFSRKAVAAGYWPSLSFKGDYGLGGTHPSTSTVVADAQGTLSIPIFTGGSVHGALQQADAKLEQSRDRLESLRAQIESDVRTALLNLQSAADSVKVARSNIDLAEQTLLQSSDRFKAGVTDSVEVVQSQELVASAHEQYISSLYNFNAAKISLVRAMGVGEQGVKEYFGGK